LATSCVANGAAGSRSSWAMREVNHPAGAASGATAPGGSRQRRYAGAPASQRASAALNVALGRMTAQTSAGSGR
jgi:hypothetical protein